MLTSGMSNGTRDKRLFSNLKAQFGSVWTILTGSKFYFVRDFSRQAVPLFFILPPRDFIELIFDKLDRSFGREAWCLSRNEKPLPLA